MDGHLDRIESQRSPNMRSSVLVSLIKSVMGILCAFHRTRGEDTTLIEETEDVPAYFLTDIEFPDLFHLPSEYVEMNPEIFSAVKAGNMEKLRSYGKQMACLKSDRGDSVLHLAAGRGHLEIVKSIVFDCPRLLLEVNSKGQLALHVAAHAGHLAVVQVLVASVTFLSNKLSEEERQRLDLYVVKDQDGDTPLHTALKAGHMKIAARLVKVSQRAYFLANNDGISPLYLVVEAGILHFVQEMLKTTGSEDRDSRLGVRLEGRKYLVHAALKARRLDIIDAILEEDVSLGDERNEKGMTCLSFAASIGYYEGVCNMLGRSKKSVYVCDDDGSFPIHVAAERGHRMIVRELIKRCPDSVYLLNKLGQNILHVAVSSGRHDLVSELKTWYATKHMANEQDVDGNSPLHLAAKRWRYLVIFILFGASGEERLETRNNDGLTPLGIAESNLQPNYIFQERSTLMALAFFHKLRDPRWKQKKLAKPLNLIDGDNYKEYINGLLLVAALIATVTFAAGFTIPGGLNNSAPNLGMATLTHHPKLILFLVFDTLAMLCSVIALATLIWAQLGDPLLIQRSLNVALPLINYALLFMPLTFHYGVIITAGHVKGFALFLNITTFSIVSALVIILSPHVILLNPDASFGMLAVFVPFLFFHCLFVIHSHLQARIILKSHICPKILYFPQLCMEDVV